MSQPSALLEIVPVRLLHKALRQALLPVLQKGLGRVPARVLFPNLRAGTQDVLLPFRVAPQELQLDPSIPVPDHLFPLG